MQAGNYSTVFTWQRETDAKDATTGQDKKTFADNGKLWGNMTYTNGTVEDEFGAPQSKVRATIRLRNWLDVKVKDRLLCEQFNELLLIEGVRKSLDPVETIVDAYVYGTLRGI